MAGELRAIDCGDAPAPGVVEVLRDMLTRAESGELQAVAVAAVGRTGHSCTQYDHNGRAVELLGVIGVLRRRVEDVFAEGF